MPLTKVETHNFDNYVVTTEKLSNTAVAAFAQTLTPKISSITETDATYTALDDTAMNTSGGYLVITGSDFQSGASVIIDTTTANSTTFVNTTTLQAQVPGKSAGTYNIYVVNPDGGTAIRVNALTYSAFPAFSTGATLSNRSSNTAFGTLIAATSDSNITYSNTSALPAGTTLLSNGWFYGTVSVGVETVYSFTVKATDVELQDTSRTFGLTVTLNPAPGLYSWGDNSLGGLGSGVENRSSPTQVGTDTWTSISSFLYSGAGVKTNGTLWSWGKNASGVLGLNDAVHRSSPTQIGSGTTWSLVSMGFYNVVATKTDGTLWAWGYNVNGNLGIGNRIDTSSPTQVGALTNWSKASIHLHCLAVKNDGTLWSWGLNTNGQLGSLSVLARSSPVQVGALTDWSQVSAGSQTSGAVKTNGTMWVWGANNTGQLGLNTVLSRSSPTQVGTDTNWSRMLLSLGMNRGMAVKSTGTLWSWGFSTKGENGLNEAITRSSPVQVGTGTDWYLIGLGTYHSLVTKTNGTLWTWGANSIGELGSDNRIYRSSPVQVGIATNWSLVSAGSGTSFALTS